MTSSLLIRIASAFILIAGFANLTLSIPYGGHFWNFAGLFIGMVEIIVAVKGIRTSLVNRKKEAREFYYYMIGLVVGIIVIEIFNAAYMLGRGLENYCDSASYTNEQCEVFKQLWVASLTITLILMAGCFCYIGLTLSYVKKLEFEQRNPDMIQSVDKELGSRKSLL